MSNIVRVWYRQLNLAPDEFRRVETSRQQLLEALTDPSQVIEFNWSGGSVLVPVRAIRKITITEEPRA